MNSLLWMFAIVLAVVFLVTGYVKVFKYPAANSHFDWVKNLPRFWVIFIVILEILGALGMFLPALLPPYAYLTAYAAIGLALLMLSASMFHFIRREFDELTVTVLLLILTAFVGYGRLVLYPLS